MARLYVSPQLHALFPEWCSFAVDWQDRTCQRPLAVGKLCNLATGTARAIQRTPRLSNDFRLQVAIERKEGTEMKDDPDDIPMVYLLYVLLAIGGIVGLAAIVVIRIL